MLESFLTVSQQVIILFILVSIGFVCGKTKLLNDTAAKGMTDFVLCIVTPCIIVNSFMREFNKELLTGLIITCLSAVFIHLASIIISSLVIRSKELSDQCVLRFASVFSNCGFMSLPLQSALLNENGVFYGAVFVAVFNIFVWSYGLVSMSGSIKSISPKKLILNPGIVGVICGLIIFLGSIKLPEIISAPIGYISALNTPIPMVIIGYHLANSDILKALKNIKSYVVAFLRLLLIPSLTMAVMYLLGIRGDVLVSCVIAASAPVAATTTMFSVKFSRNTELSVNLVSVTTILSIVTMPLIIGLCRYIAF